MMFGLTFHNATKASCPLARNEKRLGFRVVIADLPDHLQRRIAAEIVRNGQESSATLVDLSMSGMQIAGVDPRVEIEVGDTVTASIEYDGRSVTLEGAIVRTIDRGSVGIHFPESVKDGEFDPPNALATIHRRLERAWLKHRKK